MSPWILLALGLLLIYLEFFLPGAILGICGGLFVFASIWVFFQESTSMIGTLAYMAFAIAVVYGIVRLAIWRIRTAKPSRSIYSDDSQVGFQASRYDKAAVGKVGVVVTDLRPGGYILVDGKRQQALSISGYIVKGAEVEVIGGQEESLLVKIYQHKEEK